MKFGLSHLTISSILFRFAGLVAAIRGRESVLMENETIGDLGENDASSITTEPASKAKASEEENPPRN